MRIDERCASLPGSAGVFGGVGGADGFGGRATRVEGSATGPYGGLAAAYTESDSDASGEAPYKGLSVGYTKGTSPGVEASVSRSRTTVHIRESYNVNVESHVRDWIGRVSTPSMFMEWK
jgi:hypothetical protein